MQRSVVSLVALVMLADMVAPAYSRSCNTYQLDSNHNGIAIPSSHFSFINAGPGSVKIPEAGAVFPPDPNALQGFAGDEGYSYSIVLVKKSKPAEVTICIN